MVSTRLISLIVKKKTDRKEKTKLNLIIAHVKGIIKIMPLKDPYIEFEAVLFPLKN